MSPEQRKNILIVEDDLDQRDLLRRKLEKQYLISEAGSYQEVRERLKVDSPPDLVLLDVYLEGTGGKDSLDLLEEIISQQPNLPVFMMSGYPHQRLISESMQKGASQFVVKGTNEFDKLPDLISQGLKPQIPSEEIRRLKTQQRLNPPGHLVGTSPKMLAVYREIGLLARSNASVLIEGPTGTGKELVAREIHELSGRKGELHTIDCGRLSPTLQIAELFGSVKGAFTGATGTKPGHFELAERGTIFLDEVNSLEEEAQRALLRVLEERKFTRLGDEANPIKIDIRVIAASNQDLAALANQNLFRRDLFFRLSDDIIQLPPLSERREDIPQLIAHFINKSAGGESPDITEEAVQELTYKRDYPGNVRELESIISSAIAHAGGRGRIITLEHINQFVPLPDQISHFLFPAQAVQERIPLKRALEEYERSILIEALKTSSGNVMEAGRLLNMHKGPFERKLKVYRIDPTSFRKRS